MEVKEDPMFHMHRQWAAYTCGITILGNFKHLDSSYTLKQATFYWDAALAKLEVEGCGWVLVGYVDSDICKEAEQRINKLGYKEVFRSPKRINANSNNEFWFVIYDVGNRKDIDG